MEAKPEKQPTAPAIQAGDSVRHTNGNVGVVSTTFSPGAYVNLPGGVQEWWPWTEFAQDGAADAPLVSTRFC